MYTIESKPLALALGRHRPEFGLARFSVVACPIDELCLKFQMESLQQQPQACVHDCTHQQFHHFAQLFVLVENIRIEMLVVLGSVHCCQKCCVD